MRILTLIYEFPPVGGGGGRAAYDICKGLAARGHQVTVLTAHMQGLPFEECRDGIRLVRIPSFRRKTFGAGFFTMLAYIFSGFWAGIRLIRLECPDIIHTHFAVPSGALAWMLSTLTGVPYLLTAHLGDVPGGVPEKTGKWFRWVEPFTHPIWKHAKKVVAVSEHTRQLALRHYPVNIQVVHNGADVSSLSPAKLKVNIPPRLVFAGRFVQQKNPLAIIQTLAQLKDLEWHCCLLGDGPLFEDVKREIQKAGMGGRFDLPGWVTPEVVLDYFSKSDILFMPSLSEGLPVVGVQALAAGLAVVASDIGGFLDLVDHGENGYLIDAQDIPGFSKALREMISVPETLFRFRAASVEKSHQFDIQIIVDQYQSLLRDVVNRK
jgi:glycosyltransferase involved in cell wall biosynthesis